MPTEAQRRRLALPLPSVRSNPVSPTALSFLEGAPADPSATESTGFPWCVQCAYSLHLLLTRRAGGSRGMSAPRPRSDGALSWSNGTARRQAAQRLPQRPAQPPGATSVATPGATGGHHPAGSLLSIQRPEQRGGEPTRNGTRTARSPAGPTAAPAPPRTLLLLVVRLREAPRGMSGPRPCPKPHGDLRQRRGGRTGRAADVAGDAEGVLGGVI